jgi:hypothetical protein
MLSVQPAGRTTNYNTGLPAGSRVLGCTDVITRTTFKALVAGGGVLATWLAVGPNHGVAPTPSIRNEGPASIRENAAEELNSEATKLRQHVTGELRPSTRNPFRFGTPKSEARGNSSGSRSASAAASIPVVALVPPAPAYTLAGIGERSMPDGRRRTAVISGEGQLYVVTDGEIVAGRYTVVRIDSEAVLLRDTSGAELTLALH